MGDSEAPRPVVSKLAVVALIAGVIFLVPLGLGAAYLWQAGLDLRSPSDPREWIGLCARSRIDVYCRAAKVAMKDTEGPIIFLHPNKGDREITEDISNLTGGKPSQEFLQKLVRANLFEGSSLSHGKLKSLDGQEHSVNCRILNRRGICIIDGLIMGDRNNSSARIDVDGAVYLTSKPLNTSGYDFLLPVP